MQEKKVYARRVKRLQEPYQVPSENDLKLNKTKPITHYTTTAEQVAKSKLYVRNWYVPEIKNLSPYKWSDRWCRVDKYFPYAEGGPLLVDEPDGEIDLELCLNKQKKMREWSYRYIVVDQNTKFFEAMQQLEEK